MVGLADSLVTYALAELLLLWNTAVWGSSKEAEQSVGVVIAQVMSFLCDALAKRVKNAAKSARVATATGGWLYC